MSQLDDLAKGLVVDGDVDVNDLGENYEIRDDEFAGGLQHRLLDPPPERRAPWRAPQPFALVPRGIARRARFHDRQEDAAHIARVRDMERRNTQATQEFLPRWNEGEKELRAARKKRAGDGLEIFSLKAEKFGLPKAIEIREQGRYHRLQAQPAPRPIVAPKPAATAKATLPNGRLAALVISACPIRPPVSTHPVSKAQLHSKLAVGRLPDHRCTTHVGAIGGNSQSLRRPSDRLSKPGCWWPSPLSPC